MILRLNSIFAGKMYWLISQIYNLATQFNFLWVKCTDCYLRFIIWWLNSIFVGKMYWLISQIYNLATQFNFSLVKCTDCYLRFMIWWLDSIFVRKMYWLLSQIYNFATQFNLSLVKCLKLSCHACMWYHLKLFSVIAICYKIVKQQFLIKNEIFMFEFQANVYLFVVLTLKRVLVQSEPIINRRKLGLVLQSFFHNQIGTVLFY
jgi:ribosomal protein S27E